MRIVLDTSILVSAARSNQGASYRIIRSIPHQSFQIALSVGLYTEWQAVLSRPEHRPPGQTQEDVQGFIRYLAQSAWLQDIYYLWRPILPDPDDDMILELAVAARCSIIVTHNIRHFKGCDRFGITPVTPQTFLNNNKDII